MQITNFTLETLYFKLYVVNIKWKFLHYFSIEIQLSLSLESVIYDLFFYNKAVVSMSYYVIALNNDNLSDDRFLNIFYAGLVEAASGVFFFAGSTKMGAHNAFMLMMIVDGLLLGCIPLLASCKRVK